MSKLTFLQPTITDYLFQFPVFMDGGFAVFLKETDHPHYGLHSKGGRTPLQAVVEYFEVFSQKVEY